MFLVDQDDKGAQGLTFRSQTRNDKPEQHWYLQNGSTKIMLADSTLCLDGGAQSQY